MWRQNHGLDCLWLYQNLFFYLKSLKEVFFFTKKIENSTFSNKKGDWLPIRIRLISVPAKKFSAQKKSHFTIYFANNDKWQKSVKQLKSWVALEIGKKRCKNLFCWIWICACALSSESMGRALNILLDSTYFGPVRLIFSEVRTF